MKDVRFSADAKREYAEAIAYYSANAPLATVRRLEQEMLESAGLMAAFPDSHAVMSAGARRCPLHTFPDQMVYVARGQSVVVIAFMHQKRRPGYWRKRVSRSKPQ